MKRRQFLIPLSVGFVSSLTVAACSRVSKSGAASATDTITVSAAASLQDALAAIAPLFQSAHPNIVIHYNFGASGALQQQIEQGAPADVFFCAAAKQMDALAEKSLIVPGSRQNLLTNQLVLIAPMTSGLKINRVSQLNQLSSLQREQITHFAVGEFRSVPAGHYAEQVLKELSLLEPLKSKFVFGNNVRSVLAAVESGHAELGMVYATDAALSNQVKVLAIAPANTHSPIVYPIAIVKGSSNLAAAQAFIDFLATKAAQQRFEAFGFGAV